MVRFDLSLTVTEIAFLVDQNFAQSLQNGRQSAICFGYIPKANQTARKAYQTSSDSKIEDLKPGSACPAHTRNYFFPPKNDLDKRQKVKGQHKGQKQFGILILQDIRIKILK